MRNALAFAAVFVLIAAGNAVTHGIGPGGALMTQSLALIAPSTPRPETFALLGIVWALIAFGTVYFVARERAPTLARAAFTGALVGTLVDGSWNLINKAQWAAWSDTLVAVDVGWHALHGVAAGALAFILLRRGGPATSTST
jgi:hypothetical protein